MEDFNLLSDVKIRKAVAQNKEYHLSDGGGLALTIKWSGNINSDKEF